MRTEAEIKSLINALDTMESPLVVFSPELEIVAANKFAMRLGSGEIIGKKCFEVICNNKAPCKECDLPAAFQQERPAGQPGSGKPGNDRNLPCGHIYPVYSEEKLEALVCTDIGLQGGDDSHDRLKLANAFLKNLIQSSPDAIIAADLNGRIQLFNEAAQKMTGYSSQEVNANFNIMDVFAEAEVDDVVARLRSDHYGGAGRLKAYHIVILDKHRRKIPIRMDAAIICEGRKELAIIGYLRDLGNEAGTPNGTSAQQARGQHSLEGIATSVARHLKLYNQQFSDTAVRIGLIDKEQLAKARMHQERLQAKTKIGIPLGRVMVQLEYITDEQRTAIIAMQALAEEGKADGEGETLGEKARLLAKEQALYNQRFGDLAVKLGFISNEQLERSLKMQKQVQEKTKIDVPLGRVLEQLEYITEEQRAAVLAVQALAENTDPEETEADPEETEADPEEAGAEPEETGAEPEETGAEPEETGVEPEEAEAEAEEAEAEAEAEAEEAEAEAEAEAEEAEAEAEEAEAEEAEAEEAEAEEAEAEEAEAEAEEAEAEEAEAEAEVTETEPEEAEAEPEVTEAEPEMTEAESDTEGPESEEEASENKIRDYFSVEISEDKLTARLIPKTGEHADVVFSDVMDLIEAEGVRHGIIEKEEIRRFFEDQAEAREPLVIAHGYPAGKGKDPEIVYHFETNYLQAGKMLEDGTIDWKDRGEIPQVDEEDLLAKIIPGVYGAVGMDVFGNEILAEPIAQVSLTAGKGVKKTGDGNSFIASAKGTPNLSENQTLMVSPVLQIPGDVGVETGHIEFDGHIEVEGSIQSGYQVRGTSLRAQSMNNAEIYISGDIVVTSGIFESKIKCQGNVKAGHVHKSNIEAGGDLVVNKEIMDSEVELYGSCQLDYGTIVSSKIAARTGILAQNVGTAMSKASHLDVGVDHKLRREISGLKKLFSKAERKKKEIKPRIKALRIESDQINGELGDVAQKQDQIMVQSRQLQEKFAAQEAIDESVKAGYEAAVAELEARRSKIDTLVEELMLKDGQLEKAIRELEEQETEIAEEQEELEERMEVLRQRREAEKGKPVVKVSGNLFSGNKITGPKSKITIEEDCKHVNVFETDKADDGQFARWHMKIGPLR